MVDVELLKTLKILYVEDEVILRDITVKSLSSVVKEIVVASNGKEGLEKFHAQNFDLIITDIAMPIMNGIDMMKCIRESNKEIPILITTAFGSQNVNISELSKYGMNAYVMKPIDIMKLVQTIDELIRNKIK